MLYAAAAILIILGFVFPSNKIVHVVFLIYIWCLFALNTWNADYLNYQSIYLRIGRGDLWGTTVSEEGFVYFCYFFRHYLGFNYPQFLSFVASLCTVLLAIVVNLYSSRPNIVLSLFIFYPYWIMICQYRSYIATLLVLLGLYFLFFDENVENIPIRRLFVKKQPLWKREWFRTFLFVFFVVLGGCFHRIALFFLVFYVVKKISFKSLIVLTLCASAVFYSFHFPAVANIMRIFISGEKINTWLMSDGTRTIKGAIFLIVVRCGTILIEYVLWKSYKRSKTVSKKYLNFVELVLKSTILSISFLSLELFVKDYERLARITLFLSYVLFADFVKQRKVTLQKIPISYLSYYGFYLLHTAYYFYAFGGYLGIAFVPAFERNALLG